MKFIVKFIFILILIFYSSKSYSDCNFQTYKYLSELNDIKNIKNIEILIKNNNRWQANLFSAYLSSTKHGFINQKYKKKFKAKVKVIYNFGICEYDSILSITGDLKDHVIKNNYGNIVSSIKIRLKEGNVLNSVGFKIFLPATRNGINEVVNTFILRQFDILSPETFFINIKVNNIEQKYIFQEEARKEILEKNFRKEGHIFEGEEDLLINYQDYENFSLWDISLSKLLNKKFSLTKGDPTYLNMLRAFTIMQNIYLQNRLAVEHKHNRYNFEIPSNYKKKKIFDIFNILMISTNSFHGLLPHNRKFFYDIASDTLEPIYYDGGTKLSEIDKNFIDDRDSVKKLIQSLGKEEIIYIKKKLISLKRNELFLAELLLRIDDKKIKKKDLINYIEIIEKNLKMTYDYFKVSKIKKIKNIFSQPVLIAKEEYLKKINEYNFDHEIYEIKLLNFDNKENKYTSINYELICKYPYNCKNKILDKEEISKIISAKTKKNEKRKIVLGLNENSFTQLQNNKKNIRIIDFNKGKIYSNNSAKINIDEFNKVINLKQNNSNDWFILQDMSLKNWSINFLGKKIETYEKEDNFFRLNFHGLNGCLNFINVKFSNSSIYGNNGKCEDSVNIVSSEGKIRFVEVNNSFLDGLDIDFSNIKLDKVIIKDAGNDCIDFSKGTYSIYESNLINCYDNAISIGENSKVEIVSSNILDSKVGVTAKDSSEVMIKNISINGISKCFNIYNKKQEYFNAIVYYNSIQCSEKLNLNNNTLVKVN